MVAGVTVTKAELIRLTKKSEKWDFNRVLCVKKLRALPAGITATVVHVLRHMPHIKYGDESPVWPPHYRFIFELRGSWASLDVADEDLRGTRLHGLVLSEAV